jgi:hypothetical protein
MFFKIAQAVSTVVYRVAVVLLLVDIVIQTSTANKVLYAIGSLVFRALSAQ